MIRVAPSKRWLAILVAAAVTSLAIVLTVFFLNFAGNGRGNDREVPGEVVIDFDDYRGTESTLPDGMFVTGEDGDGVEIGDAFYPFTGVNLLSDSREDDFLGFGAFTADEQDYSFGIRERGDSDLQDSRLFLEYTNETDKPVHGFEVSYDVETWFHGVRDNRIRLKYHTDVSGYSAVDSIVSTRNPLGGLEEGASATPVDGSREDNRTEVSSAFMLSALTGDKSAGFEGYTPLEPGETGYLRWQYSNADIADGNPRSALSLNNVRVTPLFAEDLARDDFGNESNPERADGEREAQGDTVSPMAFSHDPGFHTEAFELSLHTTLPDATVYYTVDGSKPDPEKVMSDEEYEQLPRESRSRTLVYEGPVDIEELVARPNDIVEVPTARRTDDRSWVMPEEPVEKAAVIRAVAVSGHTRSRVQSASYFIAPDGAERYSVPVFSIVTERGDFFDPEEGLFVVGEGELPNWVMRGSEWEREAHLELFEADGSRSLRQDLGIRVHGNFTRTFPQKTLRLYSRSDYGTSRLNYRFFDSKEVDDFNRLLLRQGGNNWNRSFVADAALQTLVQHLPFGTQHYRPAIVFLNGEYWGIQNMRDRFDQHYLETHYDIPRDDLLILEFGGMVHTSEDEEKGSFYEPYVEFRERVLSGELDSWEEIDEYMALSEYLDYLFAQIYAGNFDWPHNNIIYWKYTGPDGEDEGPRDGRWRWLMYDVDATFGYRYSLTYDLVAWAFGSEEEHPGVRLERRREDQELFDLNAGLMRVEEIRHEFLQRFAVHLSTTADVERTTEHIDSVIEGIDPEIDEHIERWNRPPSRDEWEDHVDRMYEFAERRPGIVTQHLLDYFDDIDGAATLTIDGLNDRDDIELHTVRLTEDAPGVEIEDGRWTGELFTGVPVSVESEYSDLRELNFDSPENVDELSRDRRSVSFIMRGPVGLSLSQE